MNTPPIVSTEEWAAAHQQPLVKEKELTRGRDALAAAWWNWHDEYSDAQRSQWWSDRGEDDSDPADPRPLRTRSQGGDAT